MTWNSWMSLEVAASSSVAQGYRATLRLVRSALRREDWVEAEALLMRAGPIAGNDPAFLNLVGILREVEGNKDAAAEATSSRPLSVRIVGPNVEMKYDME